jgi:hypothetical protein
MGYMLPEVLGSRGLDGIGRLNRFTVAGRMQRRVRSQEVELVVAAAKANKKATGQPFWDALYAQLSSVGPQARQEVLALAQYHHQMRDVAITTSFHLTSRDVEVAIASQAKALKGTQILALSSNLTLASGQELHIPMLDFRVAVCEENQELLLQQLKTIGVSGWLFDSGRSYHFLGRDLLDGRAEFCAFLGRALLFAPIVDGRWVAHQLIEGACALRISSGNPEQISPQFVAEVRVS